MAALAIKGRALGLGGLFSVLGGLYATQGLLSGLVHEGLPVLLRARGVGLDMIGLLSLLFLPSALKFLWAPRIDRMAADRLAWAARFQVFLLAGTLSLLLLPLERALPAIMIVLLVLMLASVTQDIVTDAMAVQALPAPRRGMGNTMQIGGSYLGYLLGGGVMVVVVGHAGWSSGILYLAGLVALCAGPVLWLRRRHLPAALALHDGAAAPSLAAAWRRAPLRWGMATVVASQASVRWFTTIMLTYLVDRGFAVVEVGLLSGAGMVAAGIAGSLLGGLLLQRHGRLAMFKASLLAYLLLQLAYLCVETQGWGGKPVLSALFLLFCAAMAMGFVVLYTIMMDLASARQAGTDYSLLQCTDAWCALVFGLSAGAVTARLGYGATFLITSALALAGLLLAPRLYARAIGAAR